MELVLQICEIGRLLSPQNTDNKKIESAILSNKSIYKLKFGTEDNIREIHLRLKNVRKKGVLPSPNRFKVHASQTINNISTKFTGNKSP